MEFKGRNYEYGGNSRWNAVAPDWNLKDYEIMDVRIDKANAVAPDWNLKYSWEYGPLDLRTNAVAPDWNLKEGRKSGQKILDEMQSHQIGI